MPVVASNFKTITFSQDLLTVLDHGCCCCIDMFDVHADDSVFDVVGTLVASWLGSSIICVVVLVLYCCCPRGKSLFPRTNLQVLRPRVLVLVFRPQVLVLGP